MKLKNNKFKKARGGYSRLLQISCRKCNSVICMYQKYGPGDLRRMYLDRIIDPQVLVARKDFTCQKDHLLGVKIIWEKENRPAFRLFVDSVNKKIVKFEDYEDIMLVKITEERLKTKEKLLTHKQVWGN
ncbi:MAG: hypothetical protein NTV02_00635 [Candidatus Zambryskibacteria bacterium]|nr:hypothetical protein [Candidatus Zambryskibacteria bacterium]